MRLATQLGMGLIGVIYVLDEPSIGLHPHDKDRLIEQLRALRDRGNTVLVVEHDEDTLLAADEIIELGPEAGVEGGQLLFQGTPAGCAAQSAKVSRTGPYLSRQFTVTKDAVTKAPDGAWLTVREARANNLRGIDVRFPAGLLTCVTGVSGSGKSTLVNDILAAAAARKLNGAKTIPGKHRHIENLDLFDKLVQVDQEPIGRSPRSNPATFTGLLDLLRDLFAQVPLAKVRGYKASRFSFNVRGGRCERCQGDGAIKMDMLFMADSYAPCPACGGRRFNRETLEILFHGRSIADVLAMTVREAIVLFRNVPRVLDKLETLDAVGLGYLALGQSSTTLSGGEAQRIKLSLELSKKQQGGTLYILDEPTTGLHWVDIQRLMDLLFKLRDAGNTIIVIEHNLSVIHLADWIIDLGPGGGSAGGELIFAGPRAGIEGAALAHRARRFAKWKGSGWLVKSGTDSGNQPYGRRREKFACDWPQQLLLVIGHRGYAWPQSTVPHAMKKTSKTINVARPSDIRRRRAESRPRPRSSKAPRSTPAPRAATSPAPAGAATVITARIDVGFGNTLATSCGQQVPGLGLGQGGTSPARLRGALDGQSSLRGAVRPGRYLQVAPDQRRELELGATELHGRARLRG